MCCISVLSFESDKRKGEDRSWSEAQTVGLSPLFGAALMTDAHVCV